LHIAVAKTRIESIFHPSDFSDASEIAFAHALKIALVTGGTLHMLHVAQDFALEWDKFPAVRSTLERWGLIPANSPKSAVIGLGIDVTKVIRSSAMPVRACLNFLDKHPADLIVLAVHKHEGHMEWLEKRIGGPLTRRAGEMTLFLPEGVNGFVSLEDGTLSIRSIVIPVAAEPSFEPAIAAVGRLIEVLELPAGIVTLVHAGSNNDIPCFRVPQNLGWSWRTEVQDTDPTELILKVAENVHADLIMMTTRGTQGFLDALRGRVSERVLRGAPCAVASVPVQ
jgi:nucleotide-binding universal stress UspA family protein